MVRIVLDELSRRCNFTERRDFHYECDASFYTLFHTEMKSLSARESPTIVSSWNDDGRCEINFCVCVENESTDFIISDRTGDINSF